MNDVAFQVRHSIASDGGLAHSDAAQLNHDLRRTLHSVRGEYVTPIELLIKWDTVDIRSTHVSRVVHGLKPVLSTGKRRNDDR